MVAIGLNSTRYIICGWRHCSLCPWICS